jgi:hypothetical protein
VKADYKEILVQLDLQVRAVQVVQVALQDLKVLRDLVDLTEQVLDTEQQYLVAVPVTMGIST